ncbi:protein of unknown function [Brochothrix thermosphacta]|nr:protein of unknown function [Brochothrix thermosphacta]SPN76300.1 hypothetical protein BTEBP_60090 [Brochothrix thermosphacta]
MLITLSSDRLFLFAFKLKKFIRSDYEKTTSIFLTYWYRYNTSDCYLFRK